MMGIIELLTLSYALVSALVVIMGALVDIYGKSKIKSAFVDSLLFVLLLGVGYFFVLIIMLRALGITL